MHYLTVNCDNFYIDEVAFVVHVTSVYFEITVLEAMMFICFTSLQ